MSIERIYVEINISISQIIIHEIRYDYVFSWSITINLLVPNNNLGKQLVKMNFNLLSLTVLFRTKVAFFFFFFLNVGRVFTKTVLMRKVKTHLSL